MQKADQLTNPDTERQLTYVEEEFYELLYAVTNEPREQVLKEACDLLWVTYGYLHTLGVDPDEAFDRISDAVWIESPASMVLGTRM